MKKNVLEYLEETARRIPQATALADASGELSFAGLRQAALGLAAAMAEREAQPGRLPVAVYLPKSKESIVAFAAILYLGRPYVPLDLKSPAARLAAILENLQPAWVISDSKHSAELIRAGWPAERIVLAGAGQGSIEGFSPEQEPGAWKDGIDTDPAYIIYTSGSTGTPKGVVIPHRGILDYIDWAVSCYDVTEADSIGNQAPFHFDNSTLDIYLCFAAGARLVILPESYFSYPAKLIGELRKQRINMIFWVPSVLANVANLDILSQVDLPALTKILFAGEVMQNKHLNYWRSYYPKVLFSNLYGPTEITVDCTYYIVDREFADTDPLPIGVPCRNSDILILTDQNQPAGFGERGELCVRGSSLALGYWNEPERTAMAFTQNPLQRNYPELIYRTGDLVYRDERGEIYFAGRNDQQIKHLGYRIELGEIETAALGEGGVLNACAVYDTLRSRIVLFVELPGDKAGSEVRAVLQTRLPKYMLPNEIVQVDVMPYNANGKIDRLALQAQLSGVA